MSWWLVHELSHMAASVLYTLGIISDVKPPIGIIPCGERLYGKCDMTDEGDILPRTGERGYWLEAQLGGLVETLACEVGPGGKRAGPAESVFICEWMVLRGSIANNERIGASLQGATVYKRIVFDPKVNAKISRDDNSKLRAQVSVRIAHIEGKVNTVADALSRNRLDEARRIAPKAIFERTESPNLNNSNIVCHAALRGTLKAI